MRLRSQLLCLLIFLSVLPNVLIGQHFFRLKADFSIKEKHADGKMSLTKGTIYYDRSHNKLVYNITFPEKETWVFRDTVYYRIVKGELLQRKFIPMLPAATMFDMALSNKLDNFGLENSLYSLSSVKRDGDLVISTWTPDDRLKKSFGNVAISKKNGKLFAVNIYDVNGVLVKKQNFKSFLQDSGIIFPEEINEVQWINGIKDLRITIFRNLKVNELENDALYNFPIPGVTKSAR
jgi:hypothetical protein